VIQGMQAKRREWQFLRLTLIIITSVLPLMIIMVGFSTTPFIYAQTNNVTNSSSTNTTSTGKIFPPDAMPYNMTYGEWSAKWWQWILSIPTENNPLNDDNGRNCAVEQSGPVWFLVGTTGGLIERTCTIPSGSAILIPAINGECSYAEYPSFRSESELRSCAITQMDKATQLKARIDGVDVTDLNTYRFQSPLFNLTLPENNIFGLPAGTTQAVADGFWILLEPLTAGNHDIQFGGGLVDVSTTGTVNFATEAVYHITIPDTAATAQQPSNTTTTTIAITITDP
jgi:hypothetical protein